MCCLSQTGQVLRHFTVELYVCSITERCDFSAKDAGEQIRYTRITIGVTTSVRFVRGG